MNYWDLNHLTIYEGAPTPFIDTETLKLLFYNLPAEAVYFTEKNFLWGMITIYDYLKLEKNSNFININLNYAYLYQKNAIKAQKVIRDGKFPIPVIDDNGFLKGEYYRDEEAKYLLRNLDFLCTVKKSLNRFVLLKEKCILVAPILKKNMYVYPKICRVLSRFQIPYESISWKKIDCNDISHDTLYIFIDNLEYRLWQNMFKNGQIWAWPFRHLLESILSSLFLSGDIVSTIMQSIKQKGVMVYSMNYIEDGSEYFKHYWSECAKKIKNIIPSKTRFIKVEYQNQFFCELYTKDYANKINSMPFELIELNGYVRLKDVKSSYCNVKNGCRITCNQPSTYRNTIHIFGPCFIMGLLTEDKFTIPSILQAKINKKGYPYRVINYGTILDMHVDFMRMFNADFRIGDILIFYIPTGQTQYECIPNINLADIIKREQIPFSWSTDWPLHCNHKVNMLLAKKIYELILPKLMSPKHLCGKSLCLDIRAFIYYSYICRYFHHFNHSRYKNIGSIVMNANPFTIGHKYLVATARKCVDFLIVFVVEEDKSLLSFEDRLYLVQIGLKEYKNVYVVPSGVYILSQNTFPEYFIKTSSEDMVQNIEKELILFGTAIAPLLNIKYRFVGEEPIDHVTAQYNNAMKSILPRYGINVIELPRIKNDQIIISASNVRRLAEQDLLMQLQKQVPRTTYDFIC